MSKATGTFCVKREPFGHLADGTAIALHTLSSVGGLSIAITNFGGAITSLRVPDRDGAVADIVLGYDSLARYVAGRSFFGGIIGRFGNRIARGRFTLDGVEHTLPTNNGANHLHGGPRGFDRVVWEVQPDEPERGIGLKLTRLSPDGEEGYPGNLRVAVTYNLTDPDTLRIYYRAETDQPTPINLTNHAYFNLAGHDRGDILDHQLTLYADRFTPVDSTLIPTGELRAVGGTAFDFRQPRRIGESIDADDEQLRIAAGYDHNFVLEHSAEPGSRLAARVREPGSGRVLEIFTTEPGVQFYSGNFLDGSDLGQGGAIYRRRAGFCLETQHFPDSPNQPAFPSTILRPGEIYESTTLYSFVR